MRSVREKSWFDEWDRLARTLGELPPPDEHSGQGFQPGAYERAVANYLGDHGIFS